MLNTVISLEARKLRKMIDCHSDNAQRCTLLWQRRCLCCKLVMWKPGGGSLGILLVVFRTHACTKKHRKRVSFPTKASTTSLRKRVVFQSNLRCFLEILLFFSWFYTVLCCFRLLGVYFTLSYAIKG